MTWPFYKPQPPASEEWYEFNPKPDITALEVALLLKQIAGARCEHLEFLNLPEECQRHFELGGFRARAP